jgi:polyhydroxybutyrate depolymerase
MNRKNQLSALLLILAAGAASACKASPSTTSEGDPPAAPTFGGARPLDVFRVPAGYDKTKPAPLVLVLHGYGASGNFQNLYFRLGDIADEEGFFIAAPDGTVDGTQKRFWNATDVCCDFEKTGVDDVRYLTGLISEIRAAYAIDPKRIFVVGHSNGGAMAFRLACDAADEIAAIVSLAGPFFDDVKRCAPSSPVAVQHMHGTADQVVPYDGGPLANVHTGAGGNQPSAPSIASTWAGLDHCTAAAVEDPPIDLDGNIPGAETKVTRYAGCGAGTEVVLWSMQGSPHVPGNFVADLPRRIYSFLKTHPKP